MAVDEVTSISQVTHLQISDTGHIVIEDIQKDSNGIGTISGYFEGPVSHETTTIDTHLNEDAICKQENDK